MTNQGTKSTTVDIRVGIILDFDNVIDVEVPKYINGKHDETIMLMKAYDKALECAAGKGLKTITFSSLSAEENGFPINFAKYALIREIDHFTAENPGVLELISIVCHNEECKKAYAAELSKFTEGYYDDINVLDKKEEILELLKEYNPLIVTDSVWGYGDLEKGDFAIVLRDEFEQDYLAVIFEGELTLCLAGAHWHYDPYRLDYNYFLRDLMGILNNERGIAYLICNGKCLDIFYIDRLKISEKYLNNRVRDMVSAPDWVDDIQKYGYKIECRFMDKEKNVKFEYIQ